MATLRDENAENTASLCDKVNVRDERTVKFFSPSPVLTLEKIESDLVLIRKIVENHQSDPVLIRPCKIKNFYFAS